MRREFPIPALLHSYLFPDPSPNEPKDFQTHLAKNLVSEVRHETQRFYGSLEAVEARYPGLNYSYGPHRKRLGRFPHHARLFRAFDVLGLTDHEIAILCRWEGTLWARQRYERDEGIKVEDTTGKEILPHAERRHLKRKAADRTELRPAIVRVPSAEGIKVKTDIEVEIEDMRSTHGSSGQAHIARSRAEQLPQMAAPRPMQSFYPRHDSPLRNSPYRNGPLPNSMLMNSAMHAPLQQSLPSFIAAPPMAAPLPAPISTTTAPAYSNFAVPESQIPDPSALQQIMATSVFTNSVNQDPGLEAFLKDAGAEHMTVQQQADMVQLHGILSRSTFPGVVWPSRTSQSPSPAPVAASSTSVPSVAEGQGQSVGSGEA